MIPPPPEIKAKNNTVWWIVGAGCAFLVTFGVAVGIAAYFAFRRINNPATIGSLSKPPKLVSAMKTVGRTINFTIWASSWTRQGPLALPHSTLRIGQSMKG